VFRSGSLHVINHTDIMIWNRFYNIVYEDDRAAFDGQNVFQEIAANLSFRLPFEQEVTAGIVGGQEGFMNQ
jgi:uncharacterized membrane protein